MTRALRDYMAAVVPPEARRPARVLHGDLLLAFAAVTVERLGKPRERSRGRISLLAPRTSAVCSPVTGSVLAAR